MSRRGSSPSRDIAAENGDVNADVNTDDGGSCVDAGFGASVDANTKC